MTRTVVVGRGFDAFRAACRGLLEEGARPEDVLFEDPDAPGLFAASSAPALRAVAPDPVASRAVPRAFLEQARLACCSTEPARHAVLYRLLWRIVHGERRILDVAAEPDVARLRRIVEAVKRDVHAMHALVRFRRVVEDDGERFVAFHRPDHYVVEEAAPFFARRFPTMSWSILTPRGSAHFDGALSYGPAVERDAVGPDELDDLWRTYYAAVFNPARVSPRALKQHLPARRWSTLPEAASIPGLVRGARAEAERLERTTSTWAGARGHLPVVRTVDALAAALPACEGCALVRTASRVVPGAGPADARIVLVGEQPGDEEDAQGAPFVGPAGRVLDEALAAAGLDRGALYLTNVVKHFRFRREGKRRLHERPSASDVRACRPWLEAELVAVRPTVLVCLGSTAARALVHPRVEITKSRGLAPPTAWAQHTIVTWHPSAVLRASPDEAERVRAGLVEDLASAGRLARQAA